MYGVFTYIWLIFMVNVGKYSTIHGWYGMHSVIYKKKLRMHCADNGNPVYICVYLGYLLMFGVFFFVFFRGCSKHNKIAVVHPKRRSMNMNDRLMMFDG